MVEDTFVCQACGRDDILPQHRFQVNYGPEEGGPYPRNICFFYNFRVLETDKTWGQLRSESE